jgi:UDPglucose 6-dehydrogenase
MHKEKIGIIGLGKLGLPMLSAFVDRGFDVIGYDINEQLISALKHKKNPYKEPGIENISSSDLKWSSRFYSNLNDFILLADIIFLIVPTPTKDEIFDISFLRSALENINVFAKKNNKKITCVITSTVNPGDCDNLQKELGKIGEEGFSLTLVYSPEFIALGSVLRDMLNPDIVLLGGENGEALDKIFSIYSRLYKTFPEFHRLTFFEAETAKIAINTYVTTKISFANMVGVFVESATGSRESSQKVLNAIGGDSRIGRKYFRYGVSYGGPCFPRDNRAFSAHLKLMKINSDLPAATDSMNDFILQYWLRRIKSESFDALVIVGLAYKAGTDFLEESFMLKLGHLLIDKVAVFFVDDLIDSSDGLIKITDSSYLKYLSPYKKILVLKNYGNCDFSEKMGDITIVDVWN